MWSWHWSSVSHHCWQVQFGTGSKGAVIVDVRQWQNPNPLTDMREPSTLIFLPQTEISPDQNRNCTMHIRQYRTKSVEQRAQEQKSTNCLHTSNYVVYSRRPGENIVMNDDLYVGACLLDKSMHAFKAVYVLILFQMPQARSTAGPYMPVISGNIWGSRRIFMHYCAHYYWHYNNIIKYSVAFLPLTFCNKEEYSHESFGFQSAFS